VKGDHSMIVPVIFDMSVIKPYLQLVYFNEFLHMVKKHGYPIIANEFYAQKPSELCKKQNLQNLYNQDIINTRHYYTVPDDEDVENAWKYIISDEFCKNLSLEYGGINDAFVHLMTERDESFEILLNGFITDIKKQSDKKISAFISIINYPSLDHVAKKNDIKVIHYELGCFRKGEYRNTAMLSRYSLYSEKNTCEMAEKYEAFLQELKSSTLKLYTNKQILSLFLSPEKLNKLDLYDAEPQYELGCALGWTEDVRFTLDTHYGHTEMLFTANKAFGGDNVLVRTHPADPTGATYPVYIRNKDMSTNPIEFIVKCKRVASIMSNVSIEAAFWGRSPYSFIHCPSYYVSLHSFDITELLDIEQSYLNWYAFCWLLPNELLFDPEYLYWRLSDPSELEVFNRHLNHYLKQDKLPRQILSMTPESSIKLIKYMRKQFGKRDL